MSLQDEIDRVGKYISNPVKAPPNESCTCEWVILPLLWKAGYEHDEIMSRTLDAGGKFPDYTVLPNTHATWYLEAKTWGSQLLDEHAIQAMNYAHTTGKRWVVLSNGREWRLYDDHIQGVDASRRLVAVAQLNECSDLFRMITALSKPLATTGGLEKYAANSRLTRILAEQMENPDSEIVKGISTLLKNRFGLPNIPNSAIVDFFRTRGALPLAPKHPTSSVVEKPSQVNFGLSAQPTSIKVHRLEELSSQPETMEGSKPKSVTLPDNSETVIGSWRELAICVVGWLANQGTLPTLPFRGRAAGKHWFINSAPVHEQGKPMTAYKEINVNNRKIYVDCNRGSVDFVACLVKLCTEAGVSAAEITVYMS
jgi:hypothetical protein